MAATSSQGFFAHFRSTAPIHPSSSFSSDTTATAADHEMPSRKRSREPDDVDGDDDSDNGTERATSNFRQSVPKRSRVALARANGGDVVSDEEDEDGAGHADSGFVDGSPALSDLDDVDDEVDEDTAARVVLKSMKDFQENMASDCGIIEEVFCRNFMCHSKLRIKLGPLINFVIGHNGSGKSACLTALTMCLGGSARVSNRGSSLKDLIKEGEESATLAVKIKNQGDGAFKPEVYGRSITVERHFTKSGSSSFKLKSSEGAVVSTKKTELDDIRDYFAFQLDNPINVLTQDMARQFLSNSTPADKYKFFIRGTQLETLDQEYKCIEENYNNMLIRLDGRDEDIAVLENKMKQAQARKARSEQVGSLREKIQEMKNMHAWAQVEEQERALEACAQQVRDAEERVAEREEAYRAATGTHEGEDQAYEAAERSVEEAKRVVTPLKDELDKRRQEHKDNRDELFKNQEQQRRMREDLRSHKLQVQERSKAVEIEQARINGAEGPAHVERLQKRDELKEAVVKAKEKQEEHAPRRQELKQRHDAGFRDQEQAKEEGEKQQEAFRNANAELQRLKRSEGRPYDGYRPNVEQLVRAVNNETRWRHKPVGPMGKHVRLQQPIWGPLIEKMFGQALDGFVVTCTEDQRLLTSIMQRVRCDVPVFTGDPSPINTSGNEPEEGVNTVLRIMNIDNDLVRNQLIIAYAIDQTCLFDNSREAIDYLYSNGKPRNVKAGVTWQRDSSGRGTRYDYSRSGAEKSSPMDRWSGAARMKTDRADQITMQEDIVKRAQQALDRAEQEVRAKQNAVKVAGQAVNSHDRTANDLKTAYQKAEDAVEEITNEIESNRPQDGRLQELERQLQEKREDVETLEQQYMDASNEKTSLNKIGRELKNVVDAAEREYNDAANRQERAEKHLERVKEDRHTALLGKNKAENAVEFAKKEVETFQRRRDEQQGYKDVFIGEAEKICQRIPVEQGYDLQAIDDRIERLETDLQRAQRQAGGTHEELVLACTEAANRYNEAQAQHEQLQNYNKALLRSLRQRRLRWDLFRKHIAVRARTMFTYLLSERNFRGEIELDHDAKTLDLAVEPDLTKSSSKGRAAPTLSGGEKSFSTICLLLSIWEAMGSPIRCLDEFDVFMDSVNRTTSMSMMIQAARRSVGRQFVLITPQAMNNVEMGDDVRVHRMSDPERGQTALPFTQV
ncbi:hypothetical protein D0866_09127 [Hortaea werneckii]|uniref:RecF/RecN/SMC N-terminal domain-containing protein n=2 Tax=Hortaea werneckii TaxID=91943 RepID=A0A3M7ANM7_HORWE|nr:hypothetical protein D0866_09127 [Hortaea werneckii]